MMNGNTLLFAGLLTGAALLGNAADFFRTDEDPGKDLPADKIILRGESSRILVFSRETLQC